MGAIKMTGMRATGQARKAGTPLPSVTNPKGMTDSLDGVTRYVPTVQGPARGGPKHMQAREDAQRQERLDAMLASIEDA